MHFNSGYEPVAARTRIRASLVTLAALALAIVAFPIRSAWARPHRFVTHEAGVVDYWPRFSPDGKTLLFSRCSISSGCGGASTGGYWELWTAPARGGRASVFVSLGDVSATRSNWLWNTAAAISTPIVFTGVPVGSGEAHLWLVDPGGASPVSVTTPPTVPRGYPSWLPDGSAVTTNGQLSGATGPIIALVGIPDGADLGHLTSDDVIWTGESAVSREGSTIAFAGQLPVLGNAYSDSSNQVWIEDFNPPNVAPGQPFNPNLHQLDGLQGRTPDWSPNDRFLIFESTRGCVGGHYAIFIEAASGGRAIQATDCKLDANHAVWAPDGRRFAFSAAWGRRKQACGSGCRGIAIAPVPHKILRFGTAP
jgi:dipeptidyl aminopeptidase/acylaminoacyl peptidase